MKEYIVKEIIDERYGLMWVNKGELIRCADCISHSNRTQMCDTWMQNTPPDGHCYRAKERADRSGHDR